MSISRHRMLPAIPPFVHVGSTAAWPVKQSPVRANVAGHRLV